MKKKNLILLLLAVVLLVSSTTAFIFGEGQHVTREEMFNAIVKALALEDAETASKTFPDADQVSEQYRKSINAGVNSGLILGRDNGMLDPKTEMSLKDLDYILSRIDFKPKTITETKYVGGGGGTTTVAGCVGDDHVFQFDVTEGCYVCLCGEKQEPIGTHRATAIAEKTPFEFDGVPAVDDYYLFDAEMFVIIDGTDEKTPVPCNADLFVLNGDELEPIGFIELFEQFGRESEDDYNGYGLAINWTAEDEINAIAVVEFPEE